ncbi:carbamoyl-phosphate synthase (glutamine-hydrolyzing) cpa2 [Mortierella sp. GBA30]|nr:carbamoyl-phosphate synthase (glutamine-hydrolyzing) cpa2 [Mortierella sp. GBA30]
MRLYNTLSSLSISISLSLAVSFVLAVAYPEPEPPRVRPDFTQQQQQLPLAPFRHSKQPLYPTIKKDTGNYIGTYARFDGEQVLRVDISSLEQLKQLGATVENYNLDLWSNLRLGAVDVRVSASKMDAFKAETRNIPSSVMIPDLQALVPEQPPASLLQNRQSGEWNFTDNSFWLNYHDFDTLNIFMETMAEKFPQLVRRVSIGHTFEGREIFGMSIHGFKQKKDRQRKDSRMTEDRSEDDEDLEEEEESDLGQSQEERSWWSELFGQKRRSTKKPSKPKKHPKAIIIDSGQHAREWIGPAVVTYIAKELILGYHHNKKITRLVDHFEFVIVPLLNADGYVYTWEYNRMWRKNRQPTSIPFCPGIDPNRNWGYLWSNEGPSANPCNEAYHGPEAFAAHESKMMSDFILKRKDVISYIDLHSYSQLWMSPFGGDCTMIPKDDEDIVEAAMGAAKALHDIHGKKYTVGSICDLIQQASGGSIDWTYAVGQVKYSYFVELRDTGRYGFMLPESEILPSAEETMAAVMYLAKFIRIREKQWGNL